MKAKSDGDDGQASGSIIPHSSPPPYHPVMAGRGEHALQGDAHGKMLATSAAETRSGTWYADGVGDISREQGTTRCSPTQLPFSAGDVE
jgi:hypothetical protein